jgi:hypothetical protein
MPTITLRYRRRKRASSPDPGVGSPGTRAWCRGWGGRNGRVGITQFISKGDRRSCPDIAHGRPPHGWTTHRWVNYVDIHRGRRQRVLCRTSW